METFYELTSLTLLMRRFVRKLMVASTLQVI